MIYLCILAAIVIAITWLLACLLIPAWPAFALIWTSVFIFTLAALVFFAALIMLSTFAKDEQKKNPAVLYPLIGYVVFCFFAIFISLTLSTYSGLFILHLVGILGACTVGFVMRSAWQKSAAFAEERKSDKKVSLIRAEKLAEIVSTLRMRNVPEISTYISSVHIFSEKMRYAAGNVDAECDAELDGLIHELKILVGSSTPDSELKQKLPIITQEISNKIAKRERLALL